MKVFVSERVVAELGIVEGELIVGVGVRGEVGATDRNTYHVVLQPRVAEVRAVTYI